MIYVPQRRMSNGDKIRLDALIRSEDVRRFVLESGWAFTDLQIAALLYHSDLPLQEQYSQLRDLRDKTADNDLKKQITEYLDCGEYPNQVFIGDSDHFTEMYFEVPNPFERGDIVKARWGGYGIVDTSQKDWKETVAMHKKWQQEHHDQSYLDIILSVSFLDEDGAFVPGGANPLDLERYLPKPNGGPMDDLLKTASLVSQGKSYLSNLFFCIREYQTSIEP